MRRIALVLSLPVIAALWITEKILGERRLMRIERWLERVWLKP